MTRARDVLAWFETLPLAGLHDLVRDPFVVLAPHPDDESLGCGGLMALASRAGIPAHVAVLTDGAGSHPDSRRFPPSALVALRRDEARDAARALGVPAARLHFMAAPDTRAPHDGPLFDALADRLAGLLRETASRALFATWRYDPHGDHLAAHRIARAAAAACGVRLWSYPVWGWTLDEQQVERPRGGLRLDVASVLSAKRAAIAAHRSQTTNLIDDDPHGFRLSDALVALLTHDCEVFLDDP